MTMTKYLGDRYADKNQSLAHRKKKEVERNDQVVNSRNGKMSQRPMGVCTMGQKILYVPAGVRQTNFGK